jgi:hypothetical protein
MRQIGTVALPPHDKRSGGGVQKVLCKSQAPVILSYLDGSWTDRLAGRRLTLGIDDGMATLTIELAAAKPRATEVGEFLRKRNRVESVQIAKRAVGKRLRAMLLAVDLPVFSVKLSAAGRDVVYPASVVFGPDAVTLNLG